MTMTEVQWAEYTEHLKAERARQAELAKERAGYAHQFKVGDGATLHFYTDAQAWTVIAVSESGKTVTLQGDKAELDPTWKPDIVPGGFSGHCRNNYEQRWITSPDPDGPIRKARLTKRGWMSNGQKVSKGRRPFHDYNF